MCSFCYCICIIFIIIVSIIIIITINITIDHHHHHHLFFVVSSSSSPSLYIDHQAVGARYRLEVTDLGMGVTSREMRKMLLGWGYQVSREACQEQNFLVLNYLSISIYVVT